MRKTKTALISYRSGLCGSRLDVSRPFARWAPQKDYWGQLFYKPTHRVRLCMDPCLNCLIRDLLRDYFNYNTRQCEYGGKVHKSGRKSDICTIFRLNYPAPLPLYAHTTMQKCGIIKTLAAGDLPPRQTGTCTLGARPQKSRCVVGIYENPPIGYKSRL